MADININITSPEGVTLATEKTIVNSNIKVTIDESLLGVQLPILANEGISADLLSNKQLIDQDGNVIEGSMPNNGEISKTMDGINVKSIAIPSGYTSGGSISLDNTIDNEVNEQTVLIAEIASALEGKTSGSGGVILPSLNNPASDADILSGKEAIDGEGNVITGTIETKTDADLVVNGPAITLSAGYYPKGALKMVPFGRVQKPTIDVNSSTGLITATVDKTAGYLSATGTDSATKQLSTKAATTYFPSTSNQTIAKGTYCVGEQIIRGDTNLIAENIKSGVTIFGVNGSYEGSGSGGSVETVVGTIRATGPFIDGAFYYIDANGTLQQTSSKGTVSVMKNSIVIADNNGNGGNISGDAVTIYTASRDGVNVMYAYYVTGDFTVRL